MTDNNDAKRLIEEAFADVDLDLDGTPCPLGDNCAIHHRVDEEIMDDEAEGGRIVTYLGDYVVITSDNPDYEDPRLLFRILTNSIKPEDLPPLYETCVLHVGPEGSMADLRKLDDDAQWNAVRFVEQHNSWVNFKNAHELVVNGVKGGDIDVSKPALPREES